MEGQAPSQMCPLLDTSGCRGRLLLVSSGSYFLMAANNESFMAICGEVGRLI